MFKYTLVPTGFFSPADAHKILSEAVRLSEKDKVNYQELPHFKAVLVYALSEEGKAPVIAGLLDKVSSIAGEVKVAACFDAAALHLVIVSGEKLLAANSFPAADPVTAEYFIFAALKQFRIDPQAVTVSLAKPASREMMKDLILYCKGVKVL
ncbi:MAG: DUF3822 family protein [Bacteroidales bacterium]|nr:DUF3822 family protein [Bacteroidales bacterium]